MASRLGSAGFNKRAGNFHVKFEELFGLIKVSAAQVVKEHTYKLKKDLQLVWPVDTGRSKKAWKVVGHRSGWTLINNARNPETNFNYVGDLWYGSSKQLPYGGWPVVNVRRLKMEADLVDLQMDKAASRVRSLIRRGRSPFFLCGYIPF